MLLTYLELADLSLLGSQFGTFLEAAILAMDTAEFHLLIMAVLKVLLDPLLPLLGQVHVPLGVLGEDLSLLALSELLRLAGDLGMIERRGVDVVAVGRLLALELIVGLLVVRLVQRHVLLTLVVECETLESALASIGLRGLG